MIRRAVYQVNVELQRKCGYCTGSKWQFLINSPTPEYPQSNALARSSRRHKSAFKQQLVAGTIRRLLSLMFLPARTVKFPIIPPLPDASVIAIYHEEIMLVAQAYCGPDSVGLASGNHFGHAIALQMREMGSECVLGSSSKDGNKAVFEMLQHIKEGKRVVIAADGPRGPRRELKPGVMMIAAKARCPVCLVRVRVPGWRLNTWDRFLIPRPFANCEIEVIEYDTQSPDPETGKKKSIKQMTAEAQQIMAAFDETP